MEKEYYVSVEDLEKLNNKNAPEIEKKDDHDHDHDHGFLGILENKNGSVNSSRRDFLKLFGYSIASAAVLSSCEQPVRKAIPYLIKPEEVTPGVANFYASTFYDGNDYCSILVKVRDGRPIKIEGNTMSSVTKGGTNSRTQASVLSLYDTARYQAPSVKGQETGWDQADDEIKEKLNNLNQSNKPVYIVSSSIISPSTLAVIEDFIKKYPNTRHIQYDAVSYSGILLANQAVFGKKVVPSYRFDKANVIVSFGADFHGSWLLPVEFTKQYVKNRKLNDGERSLSRHIQIEGGMTLTGSNADERIVIKPSQEKAVLANLFSLVLKEKTGQEIKSATSAVNISGVAKELIANQGKSLVVSGSNDIDCQILVNGINYLLGNYESVIDLNTPLKLHKGIDPEMFDFISSLEKGEVGGVIFYNSNPVYDFLPLAGNLTDSLLKCELTISLSDLKNETAEVSQYICPDHYFLESWNDAEVKENHFSLFQPGIHPIHKTRYAQESLLKWSGNDTSYYDYLQNFWEQNIFPLSKKPGSFYEFWTTCVHDGIFEINNQKKGNEEFNINSVKEAAEKAKLPENEEFEIHLYENVSVGNGRMANNPWLQELPDPVTRVCWDNYAMVSPKLAGEMSLVTGSYITINDSYTLPVIVQPGQEYKTISVALGYGRKNAGKVADEVGVNVYPLVQSINNNRLYNTSGAQIKIKEGSHVFAMVQTHSSMEGRPIVRETVLKKYLENPESGNEMHAEVQEKDVTLYNKKIYPGHHWAMGIDLNSCTGCGACVVACMSENNVSVVGKNQVARAHEMHWIRIDRYYSGNIENPKVVRQPVMCQHCNNAPCENVCPVSAVAHTNDGINMQIYNRCIGTRYCNNNCPYKVRRFNFYDYNKADSIPLNTKDPAGMTLDLKRMVLNPDVVVRAKGVMEKCTFCFQRIQGAKLTAKLEERKLRDGELQTACAQACPADAIIFGDLNDPESRVSRWFNDKRNYHLLEELHTRPNVGYLTRIRNTEEET